MNRYEIAKKLNVPNFEHDNNHWGVNVKQLLKLLNKSIPLEAGVDVKTAGIDFADKEIRHILGRPCFQFIGWAEAIRKLGYPLARKAEEEQALGIYYLLWLYDKHKDKYWEFANVDSEMKLFIEQLSRFSD